MADPLSIASSVVALVTFGLQTSKILRTTIESFQNRTKTIRDLRIDVLALFGALEELNEAVEDGTAEFDRLKLPLYSCAILCSDFNGMIHKCTSRTSDSKGSFRDWTKLHFRGNDIETFRTTLAGYKSTIQVAIGAINLRSMRVTQSCLDDYRILIQDAKADLQAHLASIEDRLSLDPLLQATLDLTITKFADPQHLQQEKSSALQCLQICSDVSNYIEMRQESVANVPDDSAHLIYQSPVTTTRSSTPSSKGMTAATLDYCHRQVNMTKHGVQSRLNSLEDALESRQANPTHASEKERIQECMSLCDEALRESTQFRQNTYEDITTGEDSDQLMISTVGELISARNVSAGARSTQVFGQLSNESLQMFFQTRAKPR
ncbi:uncharacterized protein K489DRAFT_326648 [Dissoconium aciculare CBS 342.82]|uniref:Azaphilone pigments biosynthesis cluster protein L N-terminal domain-containing protein n=1 Tax=Dissoconium aciculare CBS 342.82 TaxID=1314786 RepID=A0A6J3LW02_9PEZI|nr:uncharacterized protein K489DRAFT_326648 [Dissoconium aciculare CBS 342.82]KAF1818797.1 hypothetical protein K489DRAFT_326648 [Dissoconium aciculare CBS 342.82]